MKLTELIKNLDITFNAPIDNIEITDITSSSRDVAKGSLFIALKGTATDGHLFVTDAYQREAAAVIVEDKETTGVTPHRGVTPMVPTACVENSKNVYGVLVQRWYGYPSNDLAVIGITGTNGKTTTAFLLHHVLQSHGKAGLIGTVHALIDNTSYALNNTTPSLGIVTGLIARMRDQECRYCVMEVSSHALAQDRVKGTEFKIRIFTNLTQDHLDYHGTMEEYYQSKKRLFTDYSEDALSIINIDDPYGKRLFDEITGKKISYGCSSGADVWAEHIEAGLSQISMIVHTEEDRQKLCVPIACYHNAGNILATVAASHAVGISLAKSAACLEHFSGVLGRMERVTEQGDIPVFVDYAHTPDAVENVLSAVRAIHAGTIITVFGCGGDRDKSKRPIMGTHAVTYSDTVIITNDNPRTEDPQCIIDDICTGISPQDITKKCRIILDREKAIHEACTQTTEDSIVLVLGKGHEEYQIIGTEKRYFSDQSVVREAVNKHHVID